MRLLIFKQTILPIAALGLSVPAPALASQRALLFPAADLFFLLLFLICLFFTVWYHRRNRQKLAIRAEAVEPLPLADQILDATPIEIFCFDDQLRICWVNHFAVQETDQPSPLIGASLGDIAPELLVDPLVVALHAGAPLPSANPDNKGFCPWEQSTHVLAGPDNSRFGVLYRKPKSCVLHQKNSLVQTPGGSTPVDQASETFSRMQSEFVANINHEVRTPMNAIIGYAEMLAAAELGPREKRFVHIIHKSSMALVSIFNDIMELSKIDSGRLQIMSSSVRLQTLLDDVVNQFLEAAQEKDLRFFCHIGDDLPQMFIVDGMRLKQILQNLVSNAIKYTNKGYVQLTVEGKPSKEKVNCYHLQFIVEDSGIGIVEADQQKIFELFHQYEQVVSKQYGGIGLGLTLCSRLVAMMGGTIDLFSKEGEGSCFTVRLEDVRSSDQTTLNAVAKSPAAHADLPLTILVVDDVDLIKDVFTDYFQDSSFQVLTANNEQDALMLAAREKPDIVFMDLNLPGASGREITKKMRQLDGMAGKPIIVMTGEVLTEEDYHPLFDNILQKPFRLDTLQALVDHYCRQVHNQEPAESKFADSPLDLLVLPLSLWSDELEHLRQNAISSGNLSVAVALGEALIRTGREHDQQVLHELGAELIRSATEPDIMGVDRVLLKLSQASFREPA